MPFELNPKEAELRLAKRIFFYNRYNYGRYGVCASSTSCRVGAIIGIVLGSILLLWLIVFLISLVTGGKIAHAVCCGARRRNRSSLRNDNQQPVNGIGLYTQQPPIQNQPYYNGSSSNGGYQPYPPAPYPPAPYPPAPYPPAPAYNSEIREKMQNSV